MAAHQASEIRHVLAERHSEERHLQEAWNGASETERTLDADDVNEHTNDHNGTHEDSEDGNVGGDGSRDDEMLDHGSSSPSIEDGAFTAASRTWPRRSSSLTPDSSPFVAASPYFPFAERAAHVDSPASTQQSSSPFVTSPLHFPLSSSLHDTKQLSFDHHLCGEYSEDDTIPDLDGIVEECNDWFDDQQTPTLTTFARCGLESENYPKEEEYEDDNVDGESTSMAPDLLMVRHRFATPKENLSSAQVDHQHEDDDADLSDLLLAENDPLLIDTLAMRAHSPTESAGSWSTVSNSSEDSALKDLDNRDDDVENVSFYSDERFVDSGWGGECLQDTEDIDFDFVYALHTFIATVEGQANATKGDTMVLLDDSNSYWWLVRIVKDSTIGETPRLVFAGCDRANLRV